MLDFPRFRKCHNAEFSPFARQEIKELYADARQALNLSLKILGDHAVKDFKRIGELAEKVRADEASLRMNHL